MWPWSFKTFPRLLKASENPGFNSIAFLYDFFSIISVSISASGSRVETTGGTIIIFEDELVELDGIRFYGSPWTPAFNDWAFNKSRAKIDKVWQNIPTDEHIHVLITHGPPKGILDISENILKNDDERKKISDQLFDERTLVIYKEIFKLKNKSISYDDFVKLASEK